MTTFDGNGKFTQVDFVVINGTLVASGFQSETGTLANGTHWNAGTLSKQIQFGHVVDARRLLPGLQ